MIIREIRKGLNLSQGNFAKLLGVHQTAVSQWETGRTFPEREIALRIAKISGRSIEEILSHEGETQQEVREQPFEMKMTDDGMRGVRIHMGDTVYFSAFGGAIENGMIAAVETAQGVLIRHLYKTKQGMLLVPASPKYPPVLLNEESRVLGRAYAFKSPLS